jgi:hypothetical protein
LTAVGLAAMVACRFGGATASPDTYVTYPQDAGGDAGESQEGDGGPSSSGSPGDETTINAAEDAETDALDDKSADSAGPPPGDGGSCLPSTCPSSACTLLTTPCCMSTGMCGCGYNDGSTCF